jgi:20S proteasome alpha/beta subunit
MYLTKVREGVGNSVRGGRQAVTVCVAALFRWNYSTAPGVINHGVAALTLSDRMITAGDVQYEPQQQKIAQLNARTLALIAGDFSIHSQAIQKVAKDVAKRIDLHPSEIARLYGRAIQEIKLQQAEDIFLAPLGLNTDTLLAQQRDISADFVDGIKRQMQGYRGEDVEALIVGGDGTNAHVYGVDTRGIINCADDVGFGAIGIGAWHAKSILMQLGYVNTFILAPALAAAYAAKKAAEIAPGVGWATDINLVFNDHTEPMVPVLFEGIEGIYRDYLSELMGLRERNVTRLAEVINSLSSEPKNAEGIRPIGESPQGNGGPSAATTEAAPGNEEAPPEEG